MPQYVVDFSIKEAYAITTILVELGFASSTSQARRLIEQGAVKFDGVGVDDVAMSIRADFFSSETTVKLSCGKKRFAAIHIKT